METRSDITASKSRSTRLNRPAYNPASGASEVRPLSVREISPELTAQTRSPSASPSGSPSNGKALSGSMSARTTPSQAPKPTGFRRPRPSKVNRSATPKRVAVDAGEAARRDPLGFYHGMLVERGSSRLVLCGPPVRFRASALRAAARAQEAVGWIMGQAMDDVARNRPAVGRKPSPLQPKRRHRPAADPRSY